MNVNLFSKKPFNPSHPAAASAQNQEEKFVSIDVEAAATGRGHNDRAPCWVAIVDRQEGIVYSKIIRVAHMVSPLTALTGLTADEITNQGHDLRVVLREVKALLGPHVVIVGQSPQNDVQWLQLRQGVDYKRIENIAESFKVWSPRHGNYSYFSLAKTAYGLLDGLMIHGDSRHNPIQDAQISMRLFNRFIAPEDRTILIQAKEKLGSMLRCKSFPIELMRGNPVPIDGVCGSKFNGRTCICGQPTVT